MPARLHHTVYLYLDVSTTNHNTVHLLHSEGGCFWDIVLHEGKALVLVGDAIPRERYALDGPKRLERLLYCVFFDLKVYTADIYPVTRGERMPSAP